MKPIFEKWNNFLLEADQSYYIIVDVISEKNTQLYGSIFDKIRAFPGVTVIKATQASRTNEIGNKVSRLSIKFLADPLAHRDKDFLEKLKSDIRTMKDDDGNRVLAVNTIEMPKRTDQD